MKAGLLGYDKQMLPVQTQKQAIRQGDVAFVRARRHLVTDVDAKTPGYTVVNLACLDDDAAGELTSVVWETELDAQLITADAWARVGARGFDQPDVFAAYIHSLRWNTLSATDPTRFQAPFRAGIEVMAYQLEPLRKALKLPRVNLLIADDVGLGKTIEAGLVVRELLLRQRVRNVIVAAPASVVPQWHDELLERFGLDFAILDREYIASRRALSGFTTNPWHTGSHFVISHALLRDEAYAAPLRDWLGTFKPGTLLILDEAHHAAPAGGQAYAVDSQLTRAVRDLAGRFEHRLFLTATPHNGHSNSFSALLEILDPLRFCRGVPVRGGASKLLEEVMVRRLKRDLRGVAAGFPKRRIVRVALDGLPEEAPELLLAAKLDAYLAMREARFQASPTRKRLTARLVEVGLQKRLLSSIDAFCRTLMAHRRAVERGTEVGGPSVAPTLAPAQLTLLTQAPGADDDAASVAPETLEAEAETLFEQASAAEGGLPREERLLLTEMAELAEAHRAEPDARVAYLIRWIRDELCPEGRWNGRRLLIFTEYTDTQRYLRAQLYAGLADVLDDRDRIAILHGASGLDAREDLKRAFNADPAQAPLRILIATDAAREGLNLQAHCADLFHFDLPWNPGRLEQRNGRIDRKLQPAEEVRCHYFVYAQRPEDLVLDALVKKAEIIHEELGSLGAILETSIERTLDRGIRRATLDHQVKQIAGAETIETEDEREAITTELDAEAEPPAASVARLGELERLLEKARAAVGLDERALRNALDVSLCRLGSEPLVQVGTARSGVPASFRVPDLAARAGADPTWAVTLDALRPPRPRDQRLHEWRRDAAIRPVVFHDTGRLGDGVVHLHLEHRVVKRLLAPYLAAGFQEDTLARATIVANDDSVPRVVLLGRLALYGAHSARLHDELVAVAAAWRPLAARSEALRPYAEETERRTLALLHDALLNPDALRVSDEACKARLETITADVADLLPLLQARGEFLTEQATRLLEQRGMDEGLALAKLLEAQITRIQKQLRTKDPDKLTQRLEALKESPTIPGLKEQLPGLDREGERRQLQAEKRQLDADRRHWEKRLHEMELEHETEPDRVRDGYRVHLQRLEPIGVVYLVPRS